MQTRTDNIGMTSTKDPVERFEINPAHTLSEQQRQRQDRNGSRYDTCWYVERDDQSKLVARYRSWTTTSNRPPYRKQTGWERYSADGELLDREVFFSKRSDMNYLH